MASDLASSTVKLSHKSYRKLLKKLRRKRIRQKLAIERDAREVEENGLFEDEAVEKPKVIKCRHKDDPPEWIEDEEERKRQHHMWLVREAIAKDLFVERRQLQEKQRQQKLEAERKIREEWEEQQRQENEKSKQIQEKRDREATLLNSIRSKLDEPNAPSHNPEPPVNFGTERDRQHCPFYLKTGACRFGERCSRVHLHPPVSCTILIPGMYSHFSITESFHDEYDTDINLEYEDSEKYQHFKEFYEDVLPEFKKLGEVVQFKTCCNHEPHLRGNVYIQFRRQEDCIEAFRSFNGRWYAGKQLSCEFSAVTKWKSAICGLFSQKRCPKGKNCNFLHVFHNPHNEFSEADRDYRYPSPWRGGGGGGGGSYRSPRWSQRSHNGWQPSPHSYRSTSSYRDQHQGRKRAGKRSRTPSPEDSRKLSRTGGSSSRSHSERDAEEDSSSRSRHKKHSKKRKHKHKHHRKKAKRKRDSHSSESDDDDSEDESD